MMVTEEVASRRSHCCQFGRDGREGGASQCVHTQQLCRALHCILYAFGGIFGASDKCAAQCTQSESYAYCTIYAQCTHLFTCSQWTVVAARCITGLHRKLVTQLGVCTNSTICNNVFNVGTYIWQFTIRTNMQKILCTIIVSTVFSTCMIQKMHKLVKICIIFTVFTLNGQMCNCCDKGSCWQIWAMTEGRRHTVESTL